MALIQTSDLLSASDELSTAQLELYPAKDYYFKANETREIETRCEVLAVAKELPLWLLELHPDFYKPANSDYWHAELVSELTPQFSGFVKVRVTNYGAAKTLRYDKLIGTVDGYATSEVLAYLDLSNISVANGISHNIWVPTTNVAEAAVQAAVAGEYLLGPGETLKVPMGVVVTDVSDGVRLVFFPADGIVADEISPEADIIYRGSTSPIYISVKNHSAEEYELPSNAQLGTFYSSIKQRQS